MTLHTKNIRVEVGIIPKQKEKDVIYFRDFESAARVLTKNRMKILETIKEKSPESIYQLAEILKRDQGNVTKDVNVLKKYGFVDVLKTEDGRVKSKPEVEEEAIEMLIKIGAGAFGIAKEAIEGVSSEFKGKKLDNNKKYVNEKGKEIIEPIRKSARKVAKIVADELDIVTK